MDKDRPWVAADCVVFDHCDRLLLIRRRNEPFKGQYALPGGFIEVGETTEDGGIQSPTRRLRFRADL